MSESDDTLLEPDFVITDRWRIVRKIGGGGFGEIYEAKDMVTENKIALKLERANNPKLVLKMEVAVLKSLQGTKHICRFYGCGKNESFSYIVMSLQGKSLSELRKATESNTFSISTVILLGKQVLDSLKDVHNAGFLHRDIKPSNFAMGRLPSTYRTVFILDFGLSRQYVTPDGEVRSPRSVAGFRGTVKYASYNAHLNNDLGRHDDLYSMMYMLIEMVSGQLPWRKIKDKNEVGTLKQTIDSSVLLQYMPHEFKQILHHIQGLTYFDKPDYDKIDEIFDTIMSRRNISVNEPFDWETPFLLNRKQTTNSNAKNDHLNTTIKIDEIVPKSIDALLAGMSSYEITTHLSNMKLNKGK